MKTNGKISGGQLTALLLAGRLSGCLLFTSEFFEGFTPLDCLLSTGLQGLLLFLLFVPTLWLGAGTLRTAYRLSQPLGKTVAGVYLPVCLFVLGLDIVQFSDFASKVMRDGFSVPTLTVVFIAVGLMASFYGLEALARSATVVAVFSLICLAVFTVALIPRMNVLYFPPSQEDRWLWIVEKAVSDLPRTAEILAIGLLYPHVNQAPGKACGAFAGATALTTAVVGITAVAVLGDYSAMTVYPYYAAVSSAKWGILQRLDILVIAVWLGTFFVRFTLFCRLFLTVSCRLFGRKVLLPACLAAFAVLTAVALVIQSGAYDGGWAVATQVYWWVLAIVCLLLPVGLWIGRHRCEKR